jgi:hypothetical protein
MTATPQVFERLELKYAMTEYRAKRVRDAIAPWVRPDRYNGTDGRPGYPIASLYLDSPNLAFHRAKQDGATDRFKLRIRTYGPTGPAHMEIKRKVNQVVHKLRVTVPRESAGMAARGGYPAGFESPSPARDVLDRFQFLALRSRAEPKLTVCYDREAYQSTVDSYARVTFDRHITAAAAGDLDWSLRGASEPLEWQFLDRGEKLRDGVTSLVMLELKCEPQVPLWMSSIIREHDLKKVGFSKYSIGIARCGLGVSQSHVVWRS